MKVCDLVRLITVYDWQHAVIVASDQSGWFWVVKSDGAKALWPAQMMEIVHEDR